ncbi:MAG TPA: mycofactocin radical SAM maturase [Acidimicrobiales bacterium]|nr:mycofactocin radical SAM maturase [Acidimicrobiales bacterium]
MSRAPKTGSLPVLDDAWALSSSVALRPEPFGAMAYDFSTRRLSFLKHSRLADLVRHLEEHSSALEACRDAGVDDHDLPAFGEALQRLAETGMLVRRRGARSGCTTVPAPTPQRAAGPKLADRFERGLSAPICLTWELTYACNLSCVHCLSSSGRRDPDELSTAECEAFIDELEELNVFYVNIGGGEPTIRRDFWHLLDYATGHHVGVKFSTNGSRITPSAARRLSANDYVDVQLSLDGATPEVNDAVRGAGSYATVRRAMTNLAEAGVRGFKLSVVVTRENVDQLDRFKSLAGEHGAQLRLTRLRPSGRGADVWARLHPTPEQQRDLYEWLRGQHEEVLTGDSFFHLGAYGDPLPGLNLCGAGRVVCLIDPLGDVYACPFTIHEEFRAGSVRSPGSFRAVWGTSPLFRELRSPSEAGTCNACSSFGTCRGGCMASKYFTGLPLDGPDPECVKGHGTLALAEVAPGSAPRACADHSRGRPVPVVVGRRSPRPPVGTAAAPTARSGR